MGSLNSLQILAVVVVAALELDQKLSILSTQVDDLDLGLRIHLDVLRLHEQWRIVRMRMKPALPALCNVVQTIVRCEYKETSAATSGREVKRSIERKRDSTHVLYLGAQTMARASGIIIWYEQCVCKSTEDRKAV